MNKGKDFLNKIEAMANSEFGKDGYTLSVVFSDHPDGKKADDSTISTLLSGYNTIISKGFLHVMDDVSNGILEIVSRMMMSKTINGMGDHIVDRLRSEGILPKPGSEKCKGCPDEQKCLDEKDLGEAQECGQVH